MFDNYEVHHPTDLLYDLNNNCCFPFIQKNHRKHIKNAKKGYHEEKKKTNHKCAIKETICFVLFGVGGKEVVVHQWGEVEI